MVTKFGKEIRRLRFEEDATLYDMAKSLDLTSSYLSAIENGKRQITTEILNKIFGYFNITDRSKINELTRIASEQIQSVNINLINSSHDIKNTMLMFARTVDQLTPEQVEKIKELMEGAENGQDS